MSDADLQHAPGFEAMRDKLSGRGTYMSDIALPGMLHGKLLRSPHAHARILSVDCSAALSMQGVRCVVTGADLVDLADPIYGVFLRDQPVIAIDKVRFVGDPVAAIVAVDEATAFRALQAVVVQYEVLAGVESIDAALAPGAPLLFDEPTGGVNMPVGPLCASIVDPAPNVLHEFRFAYGDIDAAFSTCHNVFTDSFALSRITHMHLEPHVNVARWVGGRLEMWSNNQDPFLIRSDMARIFGMRQHDIRVHTPLVGGGFGGKSYCKMEPLVALMARKAGRPVRLALSLDESLHTLTKHPARISLTTGVDGQGRLVARRAEILLDGGAYADASILVGVKTGFRIGGAYRWQALQARARVVRTSTIPAGSFRGFGGTQSSWASERQIDLIARWLGDDPITFRRRNMLRPGEPFAPGDSGMDCDLAAGLDEVVTRLGRSVPGRGHGVAVGLKDAGGTGNHAQALVRINQSGEVMVQAAVVDIGQGASAAMCRIATETLGLPFASARYAEIDTEHSPLDNGTHVSCGTMVTGLAVQAAANAAKAELMGFLAARLGCDPADLVLDGWNVRRGGQSVPIEPIVRRHYGGVGWEFVGRGVFKEPYDVAAPLGARNMSWMPCWSGAEVSVDRQTGIVTIHRLVVGADAGRALDMVACQGQLEGAAIQALGQAMFEELRFEAGAPANATPLAYRIPRAGDLPRRFESFITEHGMGPGPDGIKGIGEAGMLGIAAAIANAIADATGAELLATPFTPERVLAAIDRREADQASPEGSK